MKDCGDKAIRRLLKVTLTIIALSIFAVEPSSSAILDYQLWIIFTCMSAALIIDFAERYHMSGPASTLTFNVIAFILICFGRLSIAILTFFRSSFLGPVVGMVIFYPQDTWIYGLFIAGVFLGAETIVAHSLLGKPVSLAPSPPYSQYLERARTFLLRLYSFTLSRPSLTGFAFGFIARLLPEIYWWPWHIGWDTVEYLAHLRDFISNPSLFQPYYWMGALRNIPPLMDILLAPFAMVVDGWVLMKLYPPVCYGLLISAITYMSSRILKIRGKYLLASIIASTFFILNLRISWDYHRQLLGSVLIVLAVSSMEVNSYSTRIGRQLPPVSLLILSSMSHEVTAYLSAMLSISAVSYSLAREKSYSKAFSYSVPTIISIALLIFYARGVTWGSRFFGALPAGLVSYGIESTAESIAYLVAGFGPLIPLALIAVSQTGIWHRLAILFLLIAGASPLITPMTAVATWYRFMIGMAPLIIPLTIKGAEKLGTRSLILYLVFLVTPGFFFYTPEAGHASVLVSAIREFPSALTPSPAVRIALEDLNNLTAVVKDLDPDITIVSEAPWARWIHLGLRNPTPERLVWMWREIKLRDLVDYMNATKQTSIYVVTWRGRQTLVKDVENLSDQDSKLVDALKIELVRDGIYKIYKASLVEGSAVMRYYDRA